jgi:hypothetical protein
MFVKANYGHVFGGFNPVGWKSSFEYTESEEAYLFSVTDGKDREPIKCEIKRSKKHMAIK